MDDIRLPPRDPSEADTLRRRKTERPSDFAFLEFITCALCDHPFKNSKRRFYMTSCGHVVCNDRKHALKADQCAECNRRGVSHHPIEEGMPASLVHWFAPSVSIHESVGTFFSILKFQNEQLTRVARSQASRLDQQQKTVAEVGQMVRETQAAQQKSTAKIESLERELREARAQLQQSQTENATMRRQLAAVQQYRQQRPTLPRAADLPPEPDQFADYPEQTLLPQQQQFANMDTPANVISSTRKRPRQDQFDFMSPVAQPQFPTRPTTTQAKPRPPHDPHAHASVPRRTQSALYAPDQARDFKLNLEQFRNTAQPAPLPAASSMPPPPMPRTHQPARPPSHQPRYGSRLEMRAYDAMPPIEENAAYGDY